MGVIRDVGEGRDSQAVRTWKKSCMEYATPTWLPYREWVSEFLEGTAPKKYRRDDLDFTKPEVPEVFAKVRALRLGALLRGTPAAEFKTILVEWAGINDGPAVPTAIDLDRESLSGPRLAERVFPKGLLVKASRPMGVS
jgi:hypothetical protein